jgi:hypothetical protein
MNNLYGNNDIVPSYKLNGGLYTGEPFKKGAPWANVPVRPTAAYMTNINLRSANPPTLALYQLQAGYRPGNNTDDYLEGLGQFGCIPYEILDKPNPPRKCIKRIIEID